MLTSYITLTTFHFRSFGPDVPLLELVLLADRIRQGGRQDTTIWSCDQPVTVRAQCRKSRSASHLIKKADGCVDADSDNNGDDDDGGCDDDGKQWNTQPSNNY